MSEYKRERRGRGRLMNFRPLAQTVRGFSNHRRIQMLEVVNATPGVDVNFLAGACGINFRTASDHTERLVRAGLLVKRSKGRRVLHSISSRGKAVLIFLRALK